MGDFKEKTNNPVCYVGLGASAGGLEALDSFFEAMPSDSGMAFVVIQHLSPDYKSLMAELLSKHTKMNVHRAEEGMRVEPDSVYIIPPRKNLRLFHGKLLLSDQERNERGINLPIDVFFTSLAVDQKQKAVGIILSGTGSDGARGIRAIKEAGGMVIAQAEETARFDGMPRAAVATGFCDFVLPVPEMPECLLGFAGHPYIQQSAQTSAMLLDEDLLARVFALLRDVSRIDFTLYKISTVTRRLERRMTVNQIRDLREYVELMEDRRSEVQALFRELLIGVTSFYRDRKVWEDLLEKHLSKVFKDSQSREVRMWVAGCSTGEEAYTLAMVCSDWMERAGQRYDIKIFATDVDQEAITRAGQGLYPEAIAADLSPRLLTKYFHRQGDKLQIARFIREMVVFAQHNLITDPPFTNLDLVCCRNLLIYLQPVLQQKVIDSFNFALNTDGLLVLGTSETTGDNSNMFEPVDPKQKLYRSRGRSRQHTQSTTLPGNARWGAGTLGRFSGSPRHYAAREDERFVDRLLNTLADDCVPLTVVVNDQMEVLHVLGDTQGIMKLPSGKIQNDVTRMVVDDLTIPLATGLRKIFADGQDLQYLKIKINRNDDSRYVNLRIRMLQGRKGQEPLALFFVEEARDKLVSDDDGQTFDVSQASEQRIKDLEQELQFTRENLQATIEELETSNEELQATNEELLASNEELQSTNEELQSVNEELHTVNSEFQQKIMELTELNSDFDNLLTSSKIYTLFLDQNMDVRKFTPDMDSVFPIMQADIGRSFEHLRHNLVDVDPVEIVQEVQSSGHSRDVEVKSTDENWFMLRVFPYRISGGIPAGIVLTLIDINKLKATGQELMASEHRFAHLFQSLEEGVIYQDGQGRITDANQAAQDILGMDLDMLTGRTSRDPAWRAVRPDGSDFPGAEHPAMRTLRTGEEIRDEVMGVYNPQKEAMQWIKVTTVPLGVTADGKVTEVYSRFALTEELKENHGEAE